MFPEKIKLTDELIDLIISTRKEHNLTAYQLSESIGKNKSWLPNIENKRTKNISRSDLYLLFNVFAQEEDLRPEQYIVRHLPRNMMIELEDGVIAPCFHVKQMVGVETFDDFQKLPAQQFADELDFNYNRRSDKLKEKDAEACIHRLTETITHEMNKHSIEEKDGFIRLIDYMTDNFENHFEKTLEIYGNSFCPRDPLAYESKSRDEYLSELDTLQNYIDIYLRMIEWKSFLYSFIEETPFETYRFFDNIRKWDSLPDEEDEKLYYALEDIKNYHFGLYSYIEYHEDFSAIYRKVPTIEYHLLFSKMHEMFTLYIKVAKINYSFDFVIPGDSVTHDEIEELHRQTDKILFDIEKEVRSKYKNRNSSIQ